MKTSSILYQRYLAIAAAAVLLLAVAMPVLITGRASAGQVTTRKITLTSSVVNASTVTYNVSFKPFTASAAGVDATDILGIVVEFCQDSPLVGATCTKTNGVTAVQVSGSVPVAHTGSPGTPVSFTANDPAGGPMDGNTLILTHATGLSTVNVANDITFSIVATNPSGTISTPGDYGTFYARILTFNSTAVAQAYTSGTPGTHLDDGGVALSTAKQLTVSARVQEQLEFCVAAITGTIDSNGEVPANCATADFNQAATTAVNLGVIDSVTPVAGTSGLSPVPATVGGNDRNGGVLIRTNAFNGATISYFGVQDTSSGRLKVGSAACSGSTAGFDAGSSSVDQCFNSNADQDVAGNDFSVAGEKFGMTAQKYFNATTNSLTPDGEYDGNGTAAGGFAWDQSGTNNPATTLASSSSVLDYELLVLRFAARTAATTPTGSYSVTSTYIATATF